MGLFTKRTKPTLNDDTFKEPLSGGNNYNLQHELKAKDEIDKQQALLLDNQAATGIRDLEQQFNKYQYHFWQVLNFHADYFQNLFAFEFESKERDTQELYNKVLKCFRYQWLYGNCGIYKLAEKYIPVYEINAHTDANGELDYIELGLLNTIINTNELVDISKKPVWLKIKGDDDNYARLYGDVNNQPAIIKWLPFIHQQTDLLSRIYTLSYTLNKKITYTIRNNNVKMDELNLFLNPRLPLIFKLNGILGNDFSTEKIDGMGDGIDAAIKYYDFFIKCYYELLGRKLNSDAKTERNISSEIQATQENYDVLQRSIKEQRRYFLNSLKLLTGINWVDLEQAKGNENNETNGINNNNGDKSNNYNDKE